MIRSLDRTVCGTGSSTGMTSCALAILLSAFLLFQIQPAIAKAILPWFGGTPAVWTTCLLFFQAVLVAGYAYADVLARRLRPRVQLAIHAILLVAALAFAIPVAIARSPSPSPAADPTGEILRLLGTTVGLPYFLLCSTSPLLQAWAARSAPDRSPYPLYALSNVGSMGGLVSYPFVVEPLLATRAQLFWWSVGFILFAACCIVAGARMVGVTSDAPRLLPAAKRPKATTVAIHFLWCALPACGSILLLAVTNRICREVAVVPFLWVLPLAIYLASFILCFESDRWYRRRLFLPALLAASAPVALGVAPSFISLQLILSFHVLLLFVACMVCHGELARLRPEPAGLTSFFVASAVGGAAGGVFVAVIAPRVFDGYFEIHVGIVLALLLPPLAVLLESPPRFAGRRTAWFVWIQASVALAALLWLDVSRYYATSRSVRRNFYGTLRVVDVQYGPGAPRRIFVHGATSHGVELLDPARRREPTSYFARESGAGQLLDALPADRPRRLAVIGLGVGTLAAYVRSRDEIWFYEINPSVLEIAERDFHFLGDTRGEVHVEIGDGRLLLEAQAPHEFDVLFADAFSSDAVPMHLITLEAFRLYFRHLKPGGVLAVDITNRVIDLRPVVAAAAEALRKDLVLLKNQADPARGVNSALWALLSTDHALLDSLRARPDTIVELPARTLLWTDDFTSLLPILK